MSECACGYESSSARPCPDIYAPIDNGSHLLECIERIHARLQVRGIRNQRTGEKTESNTDSPHIADVGIYNEPNQSDKPAPLQRPAPPSFAKHQDRLDSGLLYGYFSFRGWNRYHARLWLALQTYTSPLQRLRESPPPPTLQKEKPCLSPAELSWH